MRLSDITLLNFRTSLDLFSQLCDKRAPELWEKYSLGKEGIGVYDVRQWLLTRARVKNTDEGMMLDFDPKQMLDDFSVMSGIGPDDVLSEKEV